MTEPAQKPGKSKQDYGTPWEFIRAVEARWGPLDIDLAATAENAKAPRYITPEQDSFKVDWAAYAHQRAWLNCEFADIGKWARRCRDYAPSLRGKKGLIFLLTPASIGSEWFAEHVNRRAMIYGLRPRMTFDGTPLNPKTGRPDAYPKDLMLSIFGDIMPGFDTWRWKP